MRAGSLLLAIAVAGCGGSDAPPRPPAPVANEVDPVEPTCDEPAPVCLPRGLTLVSTTGQTLGPGELAGKVILVTFWTTWSAPSLADIVTFNEALRVHGANGVVIVGVLLEEDLAQAELQRFAAAHEIGYPIVRFDPSLVDVFGVPIMIPTTVVYDRGGRKTFEETRSLEPGELREVLDRLTK